MKFLLILLLLCSCSYFGKKETKVQKSIALSNDKITEESKALTTGVVDALSVAPTNPPTNLALTLAKHDQQLEGLPTQRIDVSSILALNQEAIKALDKRLGYQETLLREKDALQAKLEAQQAKLVEMGKLYEEEKNRNIVKRIWRWGLSTLGLGGIIALCVLCPAVVPIIGRIFGWLVSKVPKLAGMLGVVSKNAFDSVVKGVGEIRKAVKSTNPDVSQLIDTELSKATDKSDKVLIEKRREVLKV